MCIFGFLGLCVIVAIFGDDKQTGSQNQKNAADAEELAFTESLKAFAATKVPELQKSIEEIKQLQIALGTKISELEKVLKLAGKDLSKDNDLMEWKSQLADLNLHINDLNETLLNTYITYKKFELSPETEDKRRIEGAIEKGRSTGIEVSSRYESLRNQL